MPEPIKPILPGYVPFQWQEAPVLEDEGAGCMVSAGAKIDGKVYRIVYHFVGRKVTDEEARAKLIELTDKVILMKTRYFYGDVAAIRFNGKDKQVQRTYVDANKHGKEVFTNQFDHNFKRQLDIATRKMQGYVVGSDKRQQAENRIERIKATKRLYDLLINNQRIPFNENDQFTIQKAPRPVPPPPALPPSRTTLPIQGEPAPISAEEFAEQERRIAVAQDIFRNYDERFNELEEENRRLKEIAAKAHDEQHLAENQQRIQDLNVQNAELKAAQEREKQGAERRIRELEHFVQEQAVQLEASKRAHEELNAQLHEQKGVFKKTEALLTTLQEEVIPRTTAQMDALRAERSESLRRFEEEIWKLSERQDERLAQQMVAKKQVNHLLNRDPAPAPTSIPQLKVELLDELHKSRDAEHMDHELIQREMEIIRSLNNLLQEREATIQKLEAEILRLRDILFKEGYIGVIPEVG